MEKLYCDYCGERIETDDNAEVDSRIIYAGDYCGPQFLIISEESEHTTRAYAAMRDWDSVAKMNACSSDCTLFLLTFFNLLKWHEFLKALKVQRAGIEDLDPNNDFSTLPNAFVEANDGVNPTTENKTEEAEDEDDEEDKKVEPTTDEEIPEESAGGELDEQPSSFGGIATTVAR